MKEKDFEVFLEDFCEHLDALETSVAKMKQQISKLTGVAEFEANHEWTWNPDKIKCKRAKGDKGKFEKRGDFNNSEFKAMLKDLAEHGSACEKSQGV